MNLNLTAGEHYYACRECGRSSERPFSTCPHCYLPTVCREVRRQPLAADVPRAEPPIALDDDSPPRRGNGARQPSEAALAYLRAKG